MKNSSKKKSNNTRIILICACAVFFVIALVSGYKVFTIMRGYRKSANMYNDLNSQFVSTAPATPKPKDNKPKAGTPTAESDPAEPTEPPKETSPITVDFDLLLPEWPDVKGWLYCEDTVINYPIAQDPTDTTNERYLYNFLDGTYTGNGTIFIDYRCPGDFSGYVTVIYGHHMNDGSMFGSLVKYAKQEYFDEHPSLYLNTPDKNYRIDVFSAYITDAGGSTYTFSFPSVESYGYYLDGVSKWSYIDTGVEVTTDDNIVVFSTCTYEYDDARFVVLGKLVPLEE